MASQISETNGAPASRAIDGNTNGAFTGNSVTHTADHTNPWWQVDLGKSVKINTINIYNRTDCCSDRLSPFYVLISDTPFSGNDLAAARAQAKYELYYTSVVNPSTAIGIGGVWGRYVRIQINKTISMQLAEVQVMGPEIPENLALSGTATQQSTYAAHTPASVAIDGNINASGEVNNAIAVSSPNVWWHVELTKQSYIDTIRVFGRTDCCASQGSDFWVLVSDTPFSKGNLATSRSEADFEYQVSGFSAGGAIPVGVFGKYVMIQRFTTDYLSIGEVQVWGGTNIALSGLGAEAEQSSDYSGSRLASDAIDGITSGAWADDSIANTQDELEPWWQVDLGANSFIDSISLYNSEAGAGLQGHLNNIKVMVSDVPFVNNELSNALAESKFSYTYTGGGADKLDIPVAQIGRFVRVQRTDTDELNIAEAEVMGGSLGYIDNNMALASNGGIATQVSTRDAGGAASRAIDGNTNGVFANNSVTHTKTPPASEHWWQVELPEYAFIESVEIWNRAEAPERLTNFWLMVSDTPFTSDSLSGSQSEALWKYNYTGQFPSSGRIVINNPSAPTGIAGKYVRIQQSTANILSLAEVKVHGYPMTLAIDQSASTVTVSTNNAKADGVSQNVVTAKLYDITAGDASGKVVKFTASNGATIDSTCTTNASGECSANITSATVGNSSISAFFDRVELGNSPQTVAFSALVDASKSTMAVTTNGAVADGVSANVVRVTILDVSSSPVLSEVVSFNASNGAIIGSTCVTNASGQCSVNIISNTVGDSSISAVVDGSPILPDQVITFIAPPPQSHLTIIKSYAYADGVSVNTVQATVYDLSENLAANKTVSFTASGAGVLSQNTCVTDAQGTCTVDITSERRGAVLVAASVDGVAFEGGATGLVFLEQVSVGALNPYAVLMLVLLFWYRGYSDGKLFVRNSK